MKIKVGDTVIVRRGKDKGKTGKVLEIDRSRGFVKIDGVNKAIKHKKPRNDKTPGGLFEEYVAMDISKVGIPHPSKKNASSRVGYKIDSKGIKKRILKANGKEL